MVDREIDLHNQIPFRRGRSLKRQQELWNDAKKFVPFKRLLNLTAIIRDKSAPAVNDYLATHNSPEQLADFHRDFLLGRITETDGDFDDPNGPGAA